MNTFQKFLALLTPRQRRKGLSVLALTLGSAVLEGAGMLSVMPFLTVLGNPDLLHSNATLNAFYGHAQTLGIETPEAFLIALGVGAFSLIVASATYRTLSQGVVNRYIENCRHQISTRLLETYLTQPYEFFIDRHGSDLSSTIISQTDGFVSSVLRPAYNMVAYTLFLIVITTLLVLADPWLALLAVGVLTGLYGVLFVFLKSKIAYIGRRVFAANGQRHLAVSETLGGIKEIKLIGGEELCLQRFKLPSERLATTQSNYDTLNQVPGFLIEAVIFGTLLLLTIIMMVTAGGLGSAPLGQILPTLGLYAFAAYRMKPAVHIIYQGFASLRYGQAIVGNLYLDLNGVREEQAPSSAEPGPIPFLRKISLKDASYLYPGSSKPAVSHLYIDIAVGSTVGIVGSTGAGKTTLVDLILGLLQPTHGELTVDDRPLSANTIKSWQSSLGYVPQEIFIADTTVARNIAFGVPDSDINWSLIEQCAQQAQIHKFIVNELTDRYETRVGERGIRLSGGQRQRLGIARALYRQPNVLILDEATSALDTITEHAVMNSIELSSPQRTTIIIAHRLSTVRHCDRIVFLKNGAAVAAGGYEELLSNSSEFMTMAEKS